ncbi:hypothetical protein SNOG_13183 [Parastagonospora nodorum SN15]|uniref:Uncharacterized protein n=1 Tax=Phaeosphaeria nodorum (strain SN15 / ATCC MYA-4574 / FGSC 10173) TaxID=321614 RepID=Q0U4Y1_PHANO|nr:hypothetical protein SNOG_13183 [Parastagonospora nodorum SN15]EAT79510.1 hypothetical protein SNOG_13183 [Parastagonospora nodorum SN15]
MYAAEVSQTQANDYHRVSNELSVAGRVSETTANWQLIRAS